MPEIAVRRFLYMSLISARQTVHPGVADELSVATMLYRSGAAGTKKLIATGAILMFIALVDLVLVVIKTGIPALDESVCDDASSHTVCTTTCSRSCKG